MSKGQDLQLYSACNLAYAVDFLGLGFFVVVGGFFVIVGLVLFCGLYWWLFVVFWGFCFVLFFGSGLKIKYPNLSVIY